MGVTKPMRFDPGQNGGALADPYDLT
jgi:hypothetical protein